MEVQSKNPGLETESDVSSIAIVWFPMPSEMQSSSKAPNYEWEEICNYKMCKKLRTDQDQTRITGMSI